MDFKWGGENGAYNQSIIFEITPEKECETLAISAADFYNVYGDGKLISNGPTRTAAGYSRIRKIDVKGIKQIKISVQCYNADCYACDRQEPFFGAELYSGEEVVYNTDDFLCYKDKGRIVKMPKFSGQRGFTEGYDFTATEREEIETYAVSAPIIIGGGQDRCKYKKVKPVKTEQNPFEGIKNHTPFDFEKNPKNPKFEDGFNVTKDFIEKTQSGYDSETFEYEKEYSGFIRVKAEAKEECELFLIFEEYLPDGKWNYDRSGCNQIIYLKLKQGKNEYISAEPYALKYIKAIYKGNIKIETDLILCQNDFERKVTVSGDENIEKVFYAAENTFRQNSTDIFMDCPSRERAGWLCDSYFSGIAERAFTGKNEVEKVFLENLLIAKTPEIPDGMLPKCFPATHGNGMYIPNWAMWFVLEAEEYYNATGDKEFLSKAKDKIYDIIKFFDKYVNEDGLLENLESWVFVEWSDCNRKDYLSGVNYPTNMLYGQMLCKAGEMYSDGELIARGKEIKRTVERQAYDGEFFCENARRENGKLKAIREHKTETCQYYALFFGLNTDEAFKEKMKTQFGAKRKDAYPDVSRSNAFIGNYLRLFWLTAEKEYDRVIDESVEYFGNMAEKTGTLWEHDSPKASCNHGFASVVAALLLKCIAGYETVKDGKAVLSEYKSKRFDNVKVSFNY